MKWPDVLWVSELKNTFDSIFSCYKEDERKNTPSLLLEISKPMLIVMGSADEVVADLPEKLEGVQQDNLTVETIDGADHFFRDLYADELAEKSLNLSAGTNPAFSAMQAGHGIKPVRLRHTSFQTASRIHRG